MCRGFTLALIASCTSCTTTIEPYGQALIVVDTNLPVPELAARLRVDVYKPDGTWHESRDFSLPDARDWPVSFGVYASYDDRESEALVRLRVYPEGRVRDYRGERFLPRAPVEEPFVANSRDELCANALALPLGHAILQRRGFEPILPPPFCGYYVETGSTAAFVDVPEAGTYRFEVLDVEPFDHSAFLELRRNCEDAIPLACSIAKPPSLTVDLMPGRYMLLTAGAQSHAMTGTGQGPTDLVIAAARADLWNEIDPVPINVPSEPPLPVAPLVLHNGPELTPRFEPEPALTADRLVLLRFKPGELQNLRITLRGDCLGTMADIGATPDEQRAVLAKARTCVDRDGELVPVAEAPSPSFADHPTLQGSFHFEEPCEAPSSQPEKLCVPGGMYLFGGREGAGSDTYSSLPERLVKVPRFWIDRQEVSVARYRAALAEGFAPLQPFVPLANEGLLSSHFVQDSRMCTWSSQARERENYPLNCISWYGARAFCQFYAGDLLSETQWEYVATAAGRETKTRYPWGDDAPTCERAVYARSDFPPDPNWGECLALGFGPQPLDAYGGDETPGGVKGLAGGVREWVLDSQEPLNGACWRAAGQLSALCWEEHATERSSRGAGWYAHADSLASVLRAGLWPVLPDASHGFRCAYPAP